MNLGSPPDASSNAELPGVAIGIVTNNKDPENLGRVRLRFPWRSITDESYWARIAVPMAGPDRGTYFLPEVEDEVLVAFENGDINSPYVVGALWNGQEKPPANNADENNDISLIRSRSGHEIRLDDNDQAGKVEVTSAGGHTITLDDAEGGQLVVEDAGGNTITLDATEGAITLSGATKLSIEAPMLELAADGNATLEAGGVLELKGALININ